MLNYGTTCALLLCAAAAVRVAEPAKAARPRRAAPAGKRRAKGHRRLRKTSDGDEERQQLEPSADGIATAADEVGLVAGAPAEEAEVEISLV